MTGGMLFRGPRVALQAYGVLGLRLRAQYEMRRRLGLYQSSPRVLGLGNRVAEREKLALQRVQVHHEPLPYLERCLTVGYILRGRGAHDRRDNAD